MCLRKCRPTKKWQSTPKTHLAHCRVRIVTLREVTYIESNRPKAGRCICVYEFAMGHTLQQDHRESKKADSYRGHRGYRSRRLRGYPRRIQGNRSRPSDTPAERRVCIGLLLAAFCEIFMLKLQVRIIIEFRGTDLRGVTPVFRAGGTRGTRAFRRTRDIYVAARSAAKKISVGRSVVTTGRARPPRPTSLHTLLFLVRVREQVSQSHFMRSI